MKKSSLIYIFQLDLNQLKRINVFMVSETYRSTKLSGQQILNDCFQLIGRISKLIENKDGRGVDLNLNDLMGIIVSPHSANGHN